MYAKLWRWATRQEVETATKLDAGTQRWLLKRMSGNKPAKYVGIFPLPKDRLEPPLESFGDADGDGIVWFIRTPEGIEEWLDPLPSTVFKLEAYRYTVRYTLFNDDGSCPDHTGKSGPTVERGFGIKYPDRGEPQLSSAALIRAITREIKRDAEVVRREIALREQQQRKRGDLVRAATATRDSVEAQRAAEAADVLQRVDLAIRCGGCVHAPVDERELLGEAEE